MRVLPQACGVLLYAMGAALLGVVAIDILPKLVLVLVCIGCARQEWTRQERGYGRVESIRVHEDGHLECVDPAGAVEPVRLLGGSLVLPRIAWLRIQFADGSHYGELLSGNPARHADWHGLQLIRMQCSVRFGRHDRS